MLVFELPQMSCGHCVRAVTEAVQSVDPDARVEVDLAGKTASVESAAAKEELAEAFTEAGYPPA